MSINYKIKDIQGNISDVEIDKNQTVKDFKREIEDVLQDENYRRDLINILYKQNVLQDEQTIESIGAEENTCFSISSVATVKIGFVLPKLQTYPDLNLQLENFLIDKNCTDKTKIINAICYQEPNLSPEKISIYSDSWEALNGPITVSDNKKFGLYIQEDNLTPIFFKDKNSSKTILFAFPSNEPLKTHEAQIQQDFNNGKFLYNGKSADFNKNAGSFDQFAEITAEPSKCFCLLL